MNNSIICGIDEVGRGAWAGPMCVGAVIAKDDFNIVGLKDSKKLSRKTRLNLIKDIYQSSIYSGVGSVAVAEIDKLGITEALMLASKRALEVLNVNWENVKIILDGNLDFVSKIDPKYVVETVIKADNQYQQVSAASVIAKEYRDLIMSLSSISDYKQYGFDKHSGYVTKQHKIQVEEFGVSRIHRKLWNVKK